MATSVRNQKAELIHIETDRRLGHEWDEWNGKPLPNGGNYGARPAKFFGYAALTLALLFAGAWLLWFALAPRLAGIGRPVPNALLELRAVLYTRDHVPFSEVDEVYQRALLSDTLSRP